MSVNRIDAETMKRAFISGANNLSNNKEYINELNVFPVPDGDTGTNMTLTIMTAVAEVNSVETPTIDLIAKAISGGSLRGARGNSGVILSQLFRGFCRDVKGKTELDINDLASGFAHAVETAYKAVIKPREGTILSVARGMAEKGAEALSTSGDLIDFLTQVVDYGEVILQKTPDMLPVLKEAGVVDSGGQGLLEVMKGILLALEGKDVVSQDTDKPIVQQKGAGLLEEIPTSASKGSGRDDISTADIKFGYCTEFIILLERELSDDEVEGIKEFLMSIGDSIVCVADEELVKIHVHTNHPGQAFEKGLEYGQLTRCKIDNMREEHSERVSMENEKKKLAQQDEAFEQLKAERKTSGPVKEEAPKNTVKEKYGIISVATGDGISEIFSEIGVDHIIHGGQTMNPSTDDILNAINSVNAENIYVLPNNKNIIMASRQAAQICSDKNVYVVETKSIPQGIGAVINFSPDAEPEDNLANMVSAIEDIKSGEITFAVRDTSVDGKEIRKNNIMGISDQGIDVVGTDIEQVAKDLLDKMVDEDSGLISIYYGIDVEQETAEKLGEFLEEKYPDVDLDVKYGGQPIYYYLLSVE